MGRPWGTGRRTVGSSLSMNVLQFNRLGYFKTAVGVVA
jgi:hypothetical protein